MRYLGHLRIAWLIGMLVLFQGCRKSAGKESAERYGEFIVRVHSKGLHPSAPMKVQIDDKTCGASREDRSVIQSSDSGLANVVVWIDAERLPNWSDEQMLKDHILSIEGCEFNPRVIVLPVGANMILESKDQVLHSIRGHARSNSPFHRVLPPNLESVRFRFEKSEIIPLNCDLHPWMKSFVVVAPHALYAVTDQRGVARFPKVPRQKLNVHVWHELLGIKDVEEPVMLSGRSAELDLNWDAETSKD